MLKNVCSNYFNMKRQKIDMVEVGGPDGVTIYVPRKEWDGLPGDYGSKVRQTIENYHFLKV
jgi:hypothetical protein